MQTKLRIYALSLTRNEDDAMELLQEANLRILTSRNQFADGTNFLSWAYTIMRNQFIDERRHQQFINTILCDVDPANIKAFTSSVYETERNINAESIARIINDMKDGEAMKLFLQGYKYQEIAEILSLPIGTVKFSIFTARNYLKKKLSIFR